MSLIVITPAATTPVTLTEAKAHLHVDTSDDDTLITALIAAATAHFDGPNGILGRALMSQTWDLYLDVFPTEGAIRLPLPPLLSVAGIFYIDPATGLEATFATSNYEVDAYSKPGWVVLASTASWPTPMETINAVRVRFVAGYASATLVPYPIKAAILLTIADLYENRETVVIGASATEIPMSPTVRALTAPYRVSWT